MGGDLLVSARFRRFLGAHRSRTLMESLETVQSELKSHRGCVSGQMSTLRKGVMFTAVRCPCPSKSAGSRVVSQPPVLRKEQTTRGGRRRPSTEGGSCISCVEVYTIGESGGQGTARMGREIVREIVVCSPNVMELSWRSAGKAGVRWGGVGAGGGKLRAPLVHGRQLGA